MDTDDRPETPERAARSNRRRGLLGAHTDEVIRDLQWRFLADRPEAIGTLARLRRAVRQEPGASAEPIACQLPETLLIEEWLSPDEPSPSERALHTAVTLWALHQQSRHDQGMHVLGTTFASAIRRLAADSPDQDTVYNRFKALGTAATYDELSHHSRSLVTQLRGAGIGFDYGLFADDLRTFQYGPDPVNGLTGPERIRALWGREYWRAAPKPSKPRKNDRDDKE